MKCVIAWFALLVTTGGLGIYIISLGWDSMMNSSYDGKDSASVSPIGMLISGISMAATVFNVPRFQATQRLKASKIGENYVLEHGHVYADNTEARS